MNAADALMRGVAELQLDLPEEVSERLMQYVALLEKWNKVYNLTAVREARHMVTHHLLDSLSVVPHLRANTILDLGSGAGLPGIPLALALPKSRVTLLDANQKKTVFLRQAKMELALENVEVACVRVEAWQPAERFEVVISRAFSDLRKFVTLAGRLCTREGMLAAMQGVCPKEELARLPFAFRMKKVVPLKVPGLAASRHLVLLQPE
jgi:16S rRNA (guanine527-N7)-methyltransferase